MLDPAAFRAAEASVRPPAGAEVRLLRWDDPDVAAFRAVAEVGFSWPGTAVGDAGREALAGAIARHEADGVAALRERLRSRLTVTAAASDREGPLAVGSHQPIGDVSEIVGPPPLPAARRRGLAAAITHALVADAMRRGCKVVFLSAGAAAGAGRLPRLRLPGPPPPLDHGA